MIHTKLNIDKDHGLNILFAIIDQTNLKNKHEDLFNKMRDITFYNTTKITQSDVHFYNNIDECLSKCDNYDLVLFQSVGNLIKHNMIIDLLLDYYYNNLNFFILGFVLDWESETGSNWLECHHQMLFLNIKKWKELNSPSFGNWEIKEELLPNFSRSVENFHDQYTPYWISRKEGFETKTRTKQGWNFIKTALENNLKIDNFSKAIRDCRLYLYPETDSENLYKSFLNKTDFGLKNPNQINYIYNINIPKKIWIYNSENYFFINNSDNIKTYFGTASGFKYLNILRKNDNVKFVFYDFNQQSLDWIKNLKDNWDGKDFPKFIEKQDEVLKTNFKYINGTIENNEKILNDQFNGQFDDLWQKFKKAETEYIRCNLFDREDLLNLSKIKSNGKIFFFYSNIFYNDFVIFHYSLEEIEKKRKDFMNTLNVMNYEIIFEGCDAMGKCQNNLQKKSIIKIF